MCDEPLDRIDVHGAQRPKMLSSLFCVDVQPHHDVKVQCQQFLRSKTSSDDNHMLSHPNDSSLMWLTLVSEPINEAMPVLCQQTIQLAIRLLV